MPSSSRSLKENMIKRFGSIDTIGPEKYLTDAGYKITKGWTWEPKVGVTNYSDMTRDEYDCMLYLIQEWDYGGLITVENK